MFGAVFGDVVGSPYEFDRGNKSKDFEMFNSECKFTDDTVMTVAVAEALLDAGKEGKRPRLKRFLQKLKSPCADGEENTLMQATEQSLSGGSCLIIRDRMVASVTDLPCVCLLQAGYMTQ